VSVVVCSTGDFDTLVCFYRSIRRREHYLRRSLDH